MNQPSHPRSSGQMTNDPSMTRSMTCQRVACLSICCSDPSDSTRPRAAHLLLALPLAAAVVDHEPTGASRHSLRSPPIGIVAAVLTVIALTADILKISTTAGAEFADVASAVGLKTGVWHVDNLGSTSSQSASLGQSGSQPVRSGRSLIALGAGPCRGKRTLGSRHRCTHDRSRGFRLKPRNFAAKRLASSPSRSREILVTGRCSLPEVLGSSFLHQ